MLMSKKVAVFGGSGFLGSYVADELTRRGYSVIIVDINSSEYLKEKQQFIKLDIMDFKGIKDIVENVDIVYNFIAVANLDDAIYKPVETMQINVMGNLNILEACKQAQNIKRFIYASSVYAISNEGSFYGISKYTSEKLVEEYYKRYGLKYTVIRYGSLYGERRSYNNYIYNLIKKALEEGILGYEGDENDIREYIHAADASKLSVDIIEEKQYENEHIILTGIERLKRIELLTMINEIMQNKLKIVKLSNNNFGHYKITPYSFHPTFAKKLVANPYIDMGQGLLECIKTIMNDELKNG